MVVGIFSIVNLGVSTNNTGTVTITGKRIQIRWTRSGGEVTLTGNSAGTGRRNDKRSVNNR
jgi:hypothetical protein